MSKTADPAGGTETVGLEHLTGADTAPWVRRRAVRALAARVQDGYDLVQLADMLDLDIREIRAPQPG